VPRIGDTHIDITKLSAHELCKLPNDAFRSVLEQLCDLQAADRKENQLLYYRPASEQARKVHLSDAKYIGVGGGNRSSKTETCLAELIACATGVIPNDVPEIRKHFRGPINCRIVVESLTTTLHQTILPKLKWWVWTGLPPHGGDKGHWGWVPKMNLIDGSWERSWSQQYRTLRLRCTDPDQPERYLGESTIQFMSHDQDPTDFASGEFHIILHDEPTTYAIWTEDQARTMSVNGRMFIAMTWPDDPAIAVDWIFDEIYERGVRGPQKSPQHDWFELSTRQNVNLDQEAVRSQASNWSATMQAVRMEGKPIRFSNRIHPLFTDVEHYWSFAAGKEITPMLVGDRLVCPETRSSNIVEYNHVIETKPSHRWPTVFLIDPHPRKPHMFCWIQIDPNDDYFVVWEEQIDGTANEVWDLVQNVETSFSMQIFARLIDPNMGLAPSNAARRGWTWQEEFDEAGLRCDLADDSDVGRGRINEYLAPDPMTYRPRFFISSDCHQSIFQMKRYAWDEHKRTLERDLKQKPKAKNDDYPTLFKYHHNFLPTFRGLTDGPRIIRRGDRRSSSYA